MTEHYPYEIKKLDQRKELGKDYMGFQPEYIEVGPKHYMMPACSMNELPKYFNLALRSDDVFVTSFPRSGTTWTQDLVWLVLNDLDYDTAKAKSLNERYTFLELSAFFSDELIKVMKDMSNDEDKIKGFTALKEQQVTPEKLEDMPSPRFIKSHLPLSLLPPALLDTARVVYVARNPRDVVVSYYYHYLNMNAMGFVEDFKAFFNLFLKDKLDWMPFFEHLKESWNKRNHPNMLFLFYEELYKDLPNAVRRVAEFFNKTYSEEQILQLCDHLDIKNFSKNKAVNQEEWKKIGIMKTEANFIRKGKAGGWRDHFDEEMTQQMDRWVAENLADTDLRFPE